MVILVNIMKCNAALILTTYKKFSWEVTNLFTLSSWQFHWLKNVTFNDFSSNKSWVSRSQPYQSYLLIKMSFEINFHIYGWYCSLDNNSTLIKTEQLCNSSFDTSSYGSDPSSSLLSVLFSNNPRKPKIYLLVGETVDGFYYINGPSLSCNLALEQRPYCIKGKRKGKIFELKR